MRKKEESQIDAMRAALRGDLERARERRGTTLLDRADEPDVAAEVVPEPEPEPEAEVVPEPEPEPEAEVVPEPEPAVEEPEPEPAQAEPVPAARRGLRFWRR